MPTKTPATAKSAAPKKTTKKIARTAAEESFAGPSRGPGGYLPKIKVFGVGGGGGNAVSRMAPDFSRGVEFWAINTDEQDLIQNSVLEKRKIFIGKGVTRGLGAGMNPELGRQAAEENRADIAEAVAGADLVFVTAGLGGGTGTGAAPIVAEIARQSGALTIAVVTKPFSFEGGQRMRLAEEGLAKLRDRVDAFIVIPNDKIFEVIPADASLTKAFQAVDDVLRNALHGIVDILMSTGIVNVDFADVRTVMLNTGAAIVATGMGQGKDRAVSAVQKAIASPLLEVSADGAKGVLLTFSGGRDMRMGEINEAAKVVQAIVDPEAKMIIGTYHDRKLKDNQLRVTLIATGFDSFQSEQHPLFREEQVSIRPTSFFTPPAPEKPASILDIDIELSPAQKADAPAVSPLEMGDDDGAWGLPAFLRRKDK